MLFIETFSSVTLNVIKVLSDRNGAWATEEQLEHLI